MAQGQDSERFITFDLGDIFDENTTELEQFDETEINDSDLIHFVSNLSAEQAKKLAFHDEMQDPEQEADDIDNKSNQFNKVDDYYSDELASEIHKKHTKSKQFGQSRSSEV